MTNSAGVTAVLLPCPFCGSAEVSASVGETGDGQPWHYIECESCAASAEPDVWNKRALPAPSAPPPHSQASEVVELLNASPDDYWSKITTEVERAGREVRHAHLLNHEAAHLLAWANISRNAALSAQETA